MLSDLMRRRRWLRGVHNARGIVRWLGFLPPVRRWWFGELLWLAKARRSESFLNNLHDRRVWAEHAREMNEDMSLPGDPPYWDEEECPC